MMIIAKEENLKDLKDLENQIDDNLNSLEQKDRIENKEFEKTLKEVQAKRKELINGYINISNKKHNKDGWLWEGTQDYKDEFSADINKMRTELKNKKAKARKIYNLITKFNNIGIIKQQRHLHEDTFLELLNAENIEIISTKVTIKLKAKDLYSYKAEYTAVIDGKIVSRNLNTYELKHLYTNFQALSEYTIIFDVEYSKNKINLQKALESFNFYDSRGIKGFLDTNNKETIAQQIAKYLSLFSLKDEKLTLENHASNSIDLVAASDSDNYQGIVNLTWNLKLFEIWEMQMITSNDEKRRFEDGVRGYFFLEKETSLIKFFNVFWDIYPTILRNTFFILTAFYKFSFQNNNKKTKEFTEQIFRLNNDNYYSDKKLLWKFPFASGVQVKLNVSESNKIKIFNINLNKWEGMKKNSDNKFNINSLGQINEYWKILMN